MTARWRDFGRQKNAKKLKIPKQVYRLEFEEQAVKQAKDGQSLAGVARELGLVVEQTSGNGVKAAATGKRTGIGDKVGMQAIARPSRRRDERRTRTRRYRPNRAAAPGPKIAVEAGQPRGSVAPKADQSATGDR